MSVLIKGMEMPEEGRLTLQISADGAVYVVNSCSITAETYTTDAVPVPPHGRLIDADALERRTHYDDFDCLVLDASDINDAPTIIEAEGER